jgi:hypothetical protein
VTKTSVGIGRRPPYPLSRIGWFLLPARDLDLPILAAYHVVAEGGSPELGLRDRVVAIDHDLGEPTCHGTSLALVVR